MSEIHGRLFKALRSELILVTFRKRKAALLTHAELKEKVSGKAFP